MGRTIHAVISECSTQHVFGGGGESDEEGGEGERRGKGRGQVDAGYKQRPPAGTIRRHLLKEKWEKAGLHSTKTHDQNESGLAGKSRILETASVQL